MSKAYGPCLPPAQAAAARLTVLGFFRGLQAMQLDWEASCQAEKTCSSVFMSLEFASRYLLLSCELESTQTKQLPWRWQCLFPAVQPSMSSYRLREKLMNRVSGKKQFCN